MNQKEKCRNVVVREENKRRLILFAVYVRISLGQQFRGSTYCQCHRRSSSASAKRDWVAVSCAKFPHGFDPCLPKYGLPKGHQGRTGVSRDPTHDGFRQKRHHLLLQALLITHIQTTLGGAEEDVFQDTLGQLSCDLSIFQQADVSRGNSSPL